MIIADKTTEINTIIYKLCDIRRHKGILRCKIMIIRSTRRINQPAAISIANRNSTIIYKYGRTNNINISDWSTKKLCCLQS